MKKVNSKKVIWGLCLLGLYATPAFGVSSYVKVRPRVEIVDSTKSATAVTNRTQVGMSQDNFLSYENLTLEVEATKTSVFLEDYYSNSPIAGALNASKATVADPGFTTFTKAFLKYDSGDTEFIVGERPINLDNQRFIGAVNWRQMPQTFGALSVRHKVSENGSVFAAFLYRRNGILPEANKRYRRGSGILNGSYKFSDQLSLTGYFYPLEDLHNTYGIRASGKLGSDFATFVYTLEAALQTDPLVGDTAAKDIKTSYFNVEMKAKKDTLFGKVGFEYFGDKGSGTHGFATPYATGHKFNGWADVLLGRASGGSANGLTDLNLSVGTKTKTYVAKIVYHQFNAATGSVGYGSEVDFVYDRKISDNLSINLKAAFYKTGDDLTLVDTTKYWVGSSVSF